MKEATKTQKLFQFFKKIKNESHNNIVTDFLIIMVIDSDTRFDTLNGFGAVCNTYLPYHAI